ncbi:hypothetical protein [Nonlabens ulvanivorans]|uniref:hypothetical protein n=1 Tax=Nonlabens ulvanivorans TaxID=906888 RepID=UPI003264CFFF
MPAIKYPLNLLTNKEHKDIVAKLLNLETYEPEESSIKIGKLLLPAGGIFQNGLGYEEFIDAIASKREIKIDENLSVIEKEEFLYKEIWLQDFNKLPEHKQKEWLADMEKNAANEGLDKNQMASIGSLTALTAAQLSGFGVYMLASSTVGAISSLVGVALPFAFYTSMSSFISVAIGPIGFIIAAVPLYKTFKDVESWDDFKIKGKGILNGFKTLAQGDYYTSELLLKYFAGLRIMNREKYMNKIEELEKKEVEYSIKLKEELASKTLIESEVNVAKEHVIGVQKQLEKAQADLELKQEFLETFKSGISKIELTKVDCSNEINRIKQKIKDLNTENIEPEKERRLNPSQLRQHRLSKRLSDLGKDE